MLTKIRNVIQSIRSTGAEVETIRSQDKILIGAIESLKVLCGNLACERVRKLSASTDLRMAEFQVFSQWGEDGILQFLLSHVPTPQETFVEFGVQDYLESNTRFLLLNNFWNGLIMDGSDVFMESVRQSTLSWRHTLHAKTAWITAENVDSLIGEVGIKGDIGLLSVDVDGMDYWIWQAVSVVQPRIVVVEYNALFGPTAVVTLPYQPNFDRTVAHFSNLLFGCSLAALEELGTVKGYSLIGTNSAGNNAFFVRTDLASVFPKRTAAEIFQPARFREARDASGRLSHLDSSAAQQLISPCVVLDLKTQKLRALGELLNR